jgi:hypothetical protein
MEKDFTTENENLEAVFVSNKRSFKKLERAIQMSQGQFSLILMCCNGSSMRRQVVKQLSKRCVIQIQELILHPSVNTLFTTILSAIEEPPPPALMVFGLESVVAIEELLTATNLVRNEFPKHFPFPLILCINDELLQQLIRLAPDFKSWATNPIRFEDPKSQSLNMTPITA